MQRNAGFTLIELMITIVVLAVLLAIAVPNFRNMILNNQAQAQSTELVSAMQYARSEAVKRSSPVSLCPTADGTTCSSDWTDGLMVFVDSASETATSATVGEVLKHWANSNDQAVISADRNNNPATFLRYTGTGMAAQVNNTRKEVVFSAYVKGCKGQNKSVITVNAAGMLDTKRSACPGS